MLKPEQSPQQQPMAPMPFYADPNRFTTPTVWQADPTQGWTQGQFIQQIPATSQPTLEGYTQQYSNGIYQATYQQPAGFESNTFYAGAVQVLTRPPSAPNQTQLTTRPNGSYSHTPSPVSSQPQQTNQRTNISGQYQQEYATTNQNYVPPATTPTGNVDSSQSGAMSRPSSVNSGVNLPTNNQNFQTQHTSNFTPISSSNFSPVSNASSSFVNSNMTTNSGNAMPGYPPVSSHPQLASHSYSGGYPGNELSGQDDSTESPHEDSNQHWSANSNGIMWEQNLIQQTCNNESAKTDQNKIQQFSQSISNHLQINSENKTNELQLSHQIQNSTEQQFSQADRVNLNSRLKTMILNKQQQQLESKIEDAQKIEQNKTGHFLSYSHHRRPYNLGGDGGVFTYKIPNATPSKVIVNNSNWQNIKNERTHLNGLYSKEMLEQNRKSVISENKTDAHLKTEETLSNYNIKNDTLSQEIYAKKLQHQKGMDPGSFKVAERLTHTSEFKNLINSKCFTDSEKSKPIVGLEIPPCNCHTSHQFFPEPGGYYTHLGCSNSLPNLRKDLENRTGVNGKALRIEKICYTGKEGKTPQGCPIAKWIIRRANFEEKYLIMVKQRPGHYCFAAVIVVCIVAWDGVLQGDANEIYDMLCHKLNKFGLPTNRRCATNEPRTCACQGLDPDKCGASFSFGCSWSMYYNGCKFARSKIVRKFRLSVRTEEDEVEERLQNLATHLTPLYKILAPESFKNQCHYEQVASDCRLGLKPGRPFSGVTACLDFCAHAHKDTHNMNNGCTVVVTLTKHRGFSKPVDEQLHVLPLYVVDDTDEFGSKLEQEKKITNGSIEVLHRYQCEVRIRNVPKPTCRRKKRKDESPEKSKNACSIKKEQIVTSPPGSASSNYESLQKTPTKQLQSNQVSSTVLDRSRFLSWGYEQNLYYNPTYSNHHNNSISGPPILPFNASPFNSSDIDDIYNHDYKHQNTKVNNDKNKPYNYNSFNSRYDSVLHQKQDTALNLTYPFSSNRDKAVSGTHPHFYNSTNNILDYQQNTALKVLKTTSEEYNSSTPITNKIPSTIKSNSVPQINTHKNVYTWYHENANKIRNSESWPNMQKHVKEYVDDEPTSHFSSNLIKDEKLVSPNHYSPIRRSQNLPSFNYIKKSKSFQESFANFHYDVHSSPPVYVQNPFDDSLLYSPKDYKYNDLYSQDNYYYDCDNYSNVSSPPLNGFLPHTPTQNWYQTPFAWPSPEPKTKVLGQVTDVIDNSECFNDSQVGGVAIALSHGSVLFECAKHELHATTALKNPNRQSPTRISLVFYQHRSLNKSKHGWEEHEEKMRLRKLDAMNIGANSNIKNLDFSTDISDILSKDNIVANQMMIRVPTKTTISVTTMFPMYPCMVTGPYQEGIRDT